MTTSFRPETAQIIAFPTRRSTSAHGGASAGHADADRRLAQACPVEFGSGWYHDAAVKDAERTRKS